MSMASRLTGGDADAINRESASLGQAAEAVAQQDRIPDIIQRGVRGVAASLPGTVVGGLAAGPLRCDCDGAGSRQIRRTPRVRIVAWWC